MSDIENDPKLRLIVAQEVAKMLDIRIGRQSNCRREDFDSGLFYEKLDHARRLREVDWAYVAHATGVSATTLSRMQSGRSPDAASLAALSAWAGINPANCIVRTKESS